jgi:hypothetical protein
MNPEITKDSLDLARAALGTPNDDITRTAGFNQPGSATDGLIGYDLEAPAKHMFPLITPLRNKIPRNVAGFGTQANWQVINGINTTGVRLGVSEGNRGGAISYSTYRAFAQYVECGLENYVTFKADLASKNFMDVKSEAQMNLLWALMIGEEMLDLGGIGTSANALGQTSTPTVTDVGSGGALPTGTAYYVGCVALSLFGYQQLAGTNMGQTGQKINAAAFVKGLAQTTVRTNMDGTTDTVNGGTAIPSALGTRTTGAASDSLTASVTAIPGAVAYAWYWGTTSDGSGCYLGSVTPVPYVTIAAVAANTAQKFNALASTDNSYCMLEYDGMLAQITNANSGGYVSAVNGLLTSDGGGGITQLATAFQQMFDLYRTGPTKVYANSQQQKDITALVIANGGAPIVRFNMDNGGGKVNGGAVIGSIMNPFTNQLVEIEVHPNMPPGTMLLWSDSVPYPLNDVGAIVQKKCRRDYYSIEWPINRRRYEYGTYFDGVLQCYFPPAFGVINCIAAGH